MPVRLLLWCFKASALEAQPVCSLWPLLASGFPRSCTPVHKCAPWSHQRPLSSTCCALHMGCGWPHSDFGTSSRNGSSRRLSECESSPPLPSTPVLCPPTHIWGAPTASGSFSALFMQAWWVYLVSVRHCTLVALGLLQHHAPSLGSLHIPLFAALYHSASAFDLW